MRFKSRPKVIEAVQLTGDITIAEKFVGRPLVRSAHRGGILIPTLEGDMLASPGDWIIRGIKGEFYPCKPDIFEASYEPLPEGDEE